MKIFFPLFIFSISLFLCCKKEGFISSANAKLDVAIDTLRFDTVFTSLGSVTKYFTVANDNDQKLRISSIRLGGGANSAFALNVNGTPGTQFENLELNANDSLYIFSKVTIDPNNSNNPFLVLDSIEISFNGNTRTVYLQAFGQNARYISNGIISQNTTWDNTLPYVIQKSLTVAQGVTLTIEKGTKVYAHATAPLIVAGTLKVMGDKAEADRVVFRGDRLDNDYKDLPGSWPGIIFTATSTGNEMHYTDVLNAYDAVVSVGGANLNPAKLSLDACIIQNAYDIGLYSINSSINAVNCLIAQCGNGGLPGAGGSNVILAGGGSYQFNHCTVATFAGYYQNHDQPVCVISNSYDGTIAPLNANFTNSIFYGEGGKPEDELLIQKAGTDLVNFSNVLYKMKNPEPAGVNFTDCIKNASPQFDSINTNRQQYNFHLRPGSPAIDAAAASPALIDLDGSVRPVGPRPDMGCYELQ